MMKCNFRSTLALYEILLERSIVLSYPLQILTQPLVIRIVLEKFIHGME